MTERGWVLRGPRGGLIASTFAKTRRDCWGIGFDVVSARLGEQWRTLNWKRWEASIASARRYGFEMVRAVKSIAALTPQETKP